MSDTSTTSGQENNRRSWKSFAWTVLCTGIMVSIPVYVAGYALGYVHARVERGNRDVTMVNEITAKNPKHFSSLTIDRGPLDKFRLRGTVPTQDALDHLRSEMIRSLGEHRANDILEIYVSGAEGD